MVVYVEGPVWGPGQSGAAAAERRGAGRGVVDCRVFAVLCDCFPSGLWSPPPGAPRPAVQAGTALPGPVLRPA